MTDVKRGDIVDWETDDGGALPLLVVNVDEYDTYSGVVFDTDGNTQYVHVVPEPVAPAPPAPTAPTPPAPLTDAELQALYANRFPPPPPAEPTPDPGVAVAPPAGTSLNLPDTNTGSE